MSTVINHLNEQLDEDVANLVDATTVVVNAAGEGTRLIPLTLNTPKPLVEVGIPKKPIIEWSMYPELYAGATKFLVITRYQKEKVMEALRHVERRLSKKFGNDIEIDFLNEPYEMGRAVCVKYAIQKGKISIASPASIKNGSDVIVFDFAEMLRGHVLGRKEKIKVSQIYSNKYRVPFGIGVLEKRYGGKVRDFEEKPVKFEPTNTGSYFVDGLQDFANLRKKTGHIEELLLSYWIGKGLVTGYVLNERRGESMYSLKSSQDLNRLSGIRFDSLFRKVITKHI